MTLLYKRGLLVAGGGGGGDVPAWVEALRSPGGDLPYMASDFANGRYWNNGAEVALGDIWVENTDWYDWDPSAIIPGSGIGDAAGGPVYTGNIPTLFPTGATLLVENAMPATPPPERTEYSFVDPATYNDELYWYAAGATANEGLDNGAHQFDPTNFWDGFWGAWSDGVFRFATTFSPTANAYSILGNAIVTPSMGGNTFDLSQLPTFGVGASSTGVFTRLVAIYVPQANADLPAMSAAPGAATYQALVATGSDQEAPASANVRMVSWIGGTYPFTISSIGAPIPVGSSLFTDPGNIGLLATGSAAPGVYPGLQFRITDDAGAHSDTALVTLTVDA